MSLILVSVISFDVMAKGGKGAKGEKRANREKVQPTFENGCLVIDSSDISKKGPMANILENADTNGDGCVSEEEFNTHMENRKANRGEGRKKAE